MSVPVDPTPTQLWPTSPGIVRATDTAPTVVPPTEALDPLEAILTLDEQAAALHAEGDALQLRADLARSTLSRDQLIELLRRSVRRAALRMEARRG